MYIALAGFIMFSFLIFAWFVVKKLNNIEKIIEHEKELSAERDEWYTDQISMALALIDENLLDNNPKEPIKVRVEKLEKEIISMRNEDFKKEPVKFKDGDKDVELVDVHDITFEIPGLEQKHGND